MRYRQSTRVTCYADALRHYDRVKPYSRGANKGDRPAEQRSHPHKRVRKDDDGTITYSHWGKDLIRYHPDGTVVVRGHPSTTTSAFMASVLPDGVHHLGNQTGSEEPVLLIGDWWRSSACKVVRCSSFVTLRYNDSWQVVDEDELEPFIWFELDKAAARAALKKHRWSDFMAVAKAMQALGGLPAHKYRSADVAAQHIVAGDYPEALAHCSREQRCLDWRTRQYSNPEIPVAFLRKIRDAIYEQEGALVEQRATVLTRPEYQRVRAAQRRWN